MLNGQNTSNSEMKAEVTNISPFGIWVLVNGDEFERIQFLLFFHNTKIRNNTYIGSMKKAFIFLAEGFEDVEALATADVLRRS